MKKRSKKSEFKVRESHKRTLAKAIVWRILATLTTASLVFIFTENFSLAGTIGLLDFTIKILVYYAHERVWNKLSWERKH